LIQDLRAQHDADEGDGLKPPGLKDHPEEARLRSSVEYAQWLIARDSKCTPLKSLQGKIWQQGFTSGELLGRCIPTCLWPSNGGAAEKNHLHLFVRKRTGTAKPVSHNGVRRSDFVHFRFL